jgi:hypothetical protein
MSARTAAISNRAAAAVLQQAASAIAVATSSSPVCSQLMLSSFVDLLHDKHHRFDASQTSLSFCALFRSNSNMARLSTTHRRKTVLLGVLCTSHPDRHAFGQYSEYGTSQPIPAVGVSCNNNKERVTSPVSVVPCCVLRYDPITADGQWW